MAEEVGGQEEEDLSTLATRGEYLGTNEAASLTSRISRESSKEEMGH
jgi:hypothetical protein